MVEIVRELEFVVLFTPEMCDGRTHFLHVFLQGRTPVRPARKERHQPPAMVGWIPEFRKEPHTPPMRCKNIFLDLKHSSEI